MQKREGKLLYSAGDLVAFLECEHATTLALTDLETPLPRAEDDDALRLIQDKGFAHEAGFLASLKSRGLRVAEIAGTGSAAELARETLRAMREGRDVIFQAALLDGPFYGRADFLKRVDEPSALGAWRYEAIDSKLARSPKAKFLVQLAYYSGLLASAQGAEPRLMHLELGEGGERSFRVASYSRYVGGVRERFARFAAQPAETYPERCDHCPFCPWRNLCEERWIGDDYLNQVAGITRNQIRRLKATGVSTLEAVARLGAGIRVPKLTPETLAKLRAQAALQLQKRQSGSAKVERLPLDPDRRRGFYRLPRPDPGDVFFDMEGDPFEGLEYLFGLRFVEDGAPRFEAFWAHTLEEERAAFEAVIDFLAARLKKYPQAHVYHYAHYEPTALKRLMSLYGTREAQVDDLLRRGKLVDLYKVVREAVRTSEPGLSLKDIECFFVPPREGEVQDAGASIVAFERWRESGDASLLEKIRRYNEDDCRSTHALRDWLLTLRPQPLPWLGGEPEAREDEDVTPVSPKVARIEAELEKYRRPWRGCPSPDAM